MPILPPSGEAPLNYAVLDIVCDALIEIGALAPGEQPPPDEAQWAFRKLNYLVDEWQAKAFFVYSYQFNVYTLVAGLSPHTIGPSALATFSTGSQPRPVRLESSALLLNTSSSTGLVDIPMNIRDRSWWALNQVKAIQTNVPTDVYYDPTFPDGSLYFWPVPNSQQQVRLQFWQQVAQFSNIQDPIGGPGGVGTLPPGYRPALMLSLAETLLSGENRDSQMAVGLAQRAMKARAAVFGNNAKSPRMQTQDSGMPKAGAKSGTRGDWNWASGAVIGGPPQ
jgi:hypothetical protein